jgi:hypothetical protein
MGYFQIRPGVIQPFVLGASSVDTFPQLCDLTDMEVIKNVSVLSGHFYIPVR